MYTLLYTKEGHPYRVVHTKTLNDHFLDMIFILGKEGFSCTIERDMSPEHLPPTSGLKMST